MKKVILCVVAVLLICGTLSACGSSQSKLDATATAEINIFLDNLTEQRLFAGSVLIARHGNILLSKGYGLADREQNIPNTVQTRYRIYSLTKQFTAMAILILESQGKLDVKDPICKYLVDCPTTWETITIHHLLTHTSGIPDNLNFQRSQDTSSVFLQIIARFKDVPLNFNPGEKWEYSNWGYTMLGYIIEQASGQSYEDFLGQSIFTPLKMHNTGYCHDSNGLAAGYVNQYASNPVNFVDDQSVVDAAGGLYSTVEDLYRWEQVLSTKKLVPRAYMDEMFTPYMLNVGGTEYGYGYGWAIGTRNGRPIHWHGGESDGFRSIIARYPDDQITIIVLSNQQDTDVETMLDFMSPKLFGGE